jgi:hypothetical protein
MTSYALTRTLSAVGTGSNLITAQTNGTAPSMNNSSNSRWGNPPYNVPWLFGSTSTDISYTTIAKITQVFNSRNVPSGKRNIFVDSKGYADISHIPNFVNTGTDGKGQDAAGVNKTGMIEGTIHGFNVYMTNVIQPTGASSNILNELAIGDDALAYGVQREPEIIIDNRLDKAELCMLLVASARYGVTGKRPDHIAIIQTRTSN